MIAVQRALASNKSLLTGLESCLLRPVQRALASSKSLLTGLESCLLFAVKRILGGVEILLGLGQVGRGFHALVRKGCLLRAIQLGLGSLEILSDLCLASGKCLLIAQQAKLVFLFHITQANLILVVHVCEGTVGERIRISSGNWDGAVQHGRNTGTLVDGAVDQAARGHALGRLSAGLLHQWVVLGHDALELARHCLCRLVHLGRYSLESFGLVRRGVSVAYVERVCCSHCCSTCEKSRYQAAFCGRTAPAKILCHSPVPVNLPQEQGALVNPAVLQALQRLAPGHTVFGKFRSSAFFIAAKQFLTKR